ncbi:MAG: hypothetical protein K2H83_02150 [Duncaniella sp.]|nr:hypothetical protein [Duncaniella sp.]MDE5733924.1 hypothetical protein [Duncaniella sp.]MDE6178928.1 hypothetical protein [Duncaniella sp.]
MTLSLHTILRGLLCLAASAAMASLQSCDTVDDDRIPYSEVYLCFHTVGDWNVHGIKGDAADCAIYVMDRPGRVWIPASFPFTDLDRTGYGGLLLVNDVLGNTLAYDLACPVEARRDVRLRVPGGELYAECPGCGSRYEIYTAYGHPKSGPAAEKGYALRRYSVVSGGALNYKVVTR